MASNFFISKKLRKQIERDIKKRINIENNIKIELEQFYDEIDEDTLYEVFNYIEKNGKTKQKKILNKIQQRYKDSNLVIEDTLNLVD